MCIFCVYCADDRHVQKGIGNVTRSRGFVAGAGIVLCHFRLGVMELWVCGTSDEIVRIETIESELRLS